MLITFLLISILRIVHQMPRNGDCINGHLHIAQWLIDLSHDFDFSLIDIHARDNSAFRWSCRTGNMHIVRWLIELSHQPIFHPVFSFQIDCDLYV